MKENDSTSTYGIIGQTEGGDNFLNKADHPAQGRQEGRAQLKR